MFVSKHDVIKMNMVEIPHHESRHNSYRAEDEPRSSEETPLLHRFPRPETREPRDRATLTVVSLLLLILIAGVVIGIYLLVVQSNSENILPPETPLRLVGQMQWDPDSGAKRETLESSSPFTARYVLVVQTDTPPCFDTSACARQLKNMQVNGTQSLPYNFLVSSDGQTFEALGWRRPSTMFPEYPSALVLAFIGNFTDVPPTRAQVDEARNFFAESVSLRRLEPSYTVIGKTLQFAPTYLFKTLSKLPQWSRSLSETY